MDNTKPSCTVAPPRPCNHATKPPSNATSHATSMQPTSLKALALKILSRNQPCNRNATKPEILCNQTPEKDGQKLHRVNTKKDVLMKEVGASITTETDRSQVLRFEPFLAGPKADPYRWEKALELEDVFFNREVKQ